MQHRVPLRFGTYPLVIDDLEESLIDLHTNPQRIMAWKLWLLG